MAVKLIVRNILLHLGVQNQCLGCCVKQRLNLLDKYDGAPQVISSTNFGLQENVYIVPEGEKICARSQSLQTGAKRWLGLGDTVSGTIVLVFVLTMIY